MPRPSCPLFDNTLTKNKIHEDPDYAILSLAAVISPLLDQNIFLGTIFWNILSQYSL
jgi:hypothetical protein